MLKTNAKSTGTRPMTHYLENPQAVANLFDEIAYAKCKLKPNTPKQFMKMLSIFIYFLEFSQFLFIN